MQALQGFHYSLVTVSRTVEFHIHLPENKSVNSLWNNNRQRSRIRMRNTLYLAVAAKAVAAHPLRSAFNDEHMRNGGLDQGPLHPPHPPHYPHRSYPNGPWDCSESYQHPTWSNIATASPSSQPLTTSTTPFLGSSQITTTTSMPSNSTIPSSSHRPSNSTIISTTVPRSSQITTPSSLASNSTAASTHQRPSSSTTTATGTINGTSTVTGASTFSVSSTLASTSSLASVSTSLSVLPNRTHSAPVASSTPSANATYRSYCGDGSVAQGWPSMSQWLPFDYL